MLIDILSIFGFVILSYNVLNIIIQRKFWFQKKYKIPETEYLSVICIKSFSTYIKGDIYQCSHWVEDHHNFESYIMGKDTKRYFCWSGYYIVPIMDKKKFDEYFIDINKHRDRQINKLLF